MHVQQECTVANWNLDCTALVYIYIYIQAKINNIYFFQSTLKRISDWELYFFNPYPWRGKLVTYDRNFDLKIRRNDKKNSYERRVYESVDDRNLF